MTRHSHLDPSPFFLAGGETGCLLVHGFTGAPPEMRLLADYLGARDITVSVPLLPGHGTEPAELNHVVWTDWIAAAEVALRALQKRCRQVFVGGLSLGALITLYLGASHPEIQGLLPYSPPIVVTDKLIYVTPILKYVIRFWPKDSDADSDLTDPKAEKRLWSYDVNPTAGAHQVLKLQRLVRRRLSDIQQPLCIFQSTGDAVIEAKSGSIIMDNVSSTDKELITLHNSGHCITVDSERSFVFARSYNFILAHTNSE
jgi:carboxylesterase